MKKLFKMEPIYVSQNLSKTKLKSKKDFEVYLNLCNTPFASDIFSLCDRTQTFNMPLEHEIRLPITKILSDNQTYDDACDSRAKEIIAVAEQLDQQIHFMWSGGVDSTVILSSFIKNSSESQQKRFTVLLTQNSIRENPIFFKNYILEKLNYKSALNFIEIVNKGNSMIVHGECQDQIFGTGGGKMFMVNELEVLATTENIKKFIISDTAYSTELLNEIINDFIYMLKCSAQSVGVDLDTIGEYLWWKSLCFGFQSMDVRYFQFHYDKSIDLKSSNQNIITFFMSQKFDQWVMQNVQYNKHIPSIQRIFKPYKREAKKYIFNFDKNQEYFDKKGKVNSGGMIASSLSKKYILDNSFESVPIDKLIEYYNPDNYFSKYR